MNKNFRNNQDKLELNEKIFEGYSDSKLEKLVDPTNVNTGRAPWVYWTSELYSFGRLYRDWGCYPSWLPIFVYSDHGIHKPAEFSPHEKNNDANVHFTFNSERVLNNKNIESKEVILVTHPWVRYRKKNNIKQLKDAIGTLVFVSHTCEGIEINDDDNDVYFKMLNDLPDKYKPLVLCVHMHDIKNGYHKKLRKYGIPIITVGNTSSVEFVKRFYEIVKNFRFATSNVGGSQLYYCAEMGVPYLLYGDRPKLINYSNLDVPLGVLDIYDTTQEELVEIEKTLFKSGSDRVNLHQKIYVEWMLGLNSNSTRLKITWILWREFFRNWKKWHIMFRPSVEFILRKLGLMKTIKIS